MITVMKASAGSGKTFALAQKYIRMLLGSSDPHEYRHILAVTFTNKATDEMKSRIIEELFKIAHPEIAGPSRMDVPNRPDLAARILSDILHDYTSFAVSTIDKFFQQTLRAFARELGHFNRMQVELDKVSLVEEAVDTILDELDADNPKDRRMINYIVDNVEEQAQEGGALNVDKSLKEMAKVLKSEAFVRMCRELGTDLSTAYSDEELRAISKRCKDVVAKYQKDVSDAAQAVADAVQSIGLEYSSFNRGWIQFVNDYIGLDLGKQKLKPISDANRLKITEPSEKGWFKKADAALFPSAVEAVLPALEKLLAAFDNSRDLYTALIIKKQLYGLGVAASLFETFDRISREKNVICLDESNTMLHDIIDGSDAPFVYEKTGTRFGTFLLDEFQDTSLTQWDNFLPLLQESESHKTEDLQDSDNLIVGDIKQSIYRWREGEWTLLDHGVEDSLKGHTRKNPLEHNWRSLKEIVEFNNSLYPALAKMLDDLNEIPSGESSVSALYEGCAQQLGKPESQQGGSVELSFVHDDQDEQLDRIVSSIRDLYDNYGARYSDIAILVRGHETGTEIAQCLVDNGIPVVTDSALLLKNSVSVRRLVSMMSYVNDPSDDVGSYMAKQYGLDSVPTAYHSLPDLVESLYNTLCARPEHKEECDSEVMYIVSFMDLVMDYSNNTGNNLGSFLEYWGRCKATVNATSGSDAVQIMTIHKSKGLSFPYVIVPYLEKTKLFYDTKTQLWAGLEVEDGPFAQYANRPFYIPMTGNTGNSAFTQRYLREKYNQGVDALNLLYVATTRAEKGMLLMACDNIKNYGNSIAALLQQYSTDAKLGEIFDFGAWHRKKDEEAAADVNAVKEYALQCPCHSIEERLAIRPYAADFFTHPGNTYEGLSYRERGIVLHDILSRVMKAGDLDLSVEAAVADGSLAEDSRNKVLSFLGRRIAAHPEFFADGVKVLAETSIIGSDGKEHRPDRVLIYPDGSVLVIDFKFGSPDDRYFGQIADYRDLFMKMGYSKVKAVLWYVYQNSVVDFVPENLL